MRNIIKLGYVAILLMIPFMVSGQENSITAQLRMEIDSIAKAHNIKEGIVNFQRVGSRFDNTYTESESLSRRDKFVLKGLTYMEKLGIGKTCHNSCLTSFCLKNKLD